MNIKTISILGAGWLGTELASKLLLENKYHIKVSTTSINKIDKFIKMGLEPYLINFSPTLNNMSASGINSDNNFLHFFKSDLLIISIPPKVKTYGEEFHLNQIKELINYLLSVPNSFDGYIIYLSSTSVYGDYQGIVDEETPATPSKASGRVILAVENILKEKFTNKLTIIRLGGLIGPGREPSHFSKKNPKLIDSNLPINLIHLDDACRVIISVIKESAWNETFNAVSDEHISKNEFYKNILLSESTTSSVSISLHAYININVNVNSLNIFPNKNQKNVNNFSNNGKIVLNNKVKYLLRKNR
ncbi:MAG: hypothetical protein HQK51_01425 [Oligoflexia bacterium]|nr:hypothetical protein [Oligoflexia bacterium]